MSTINFLKPSKYTRCGTKSARLGILVLVVALLTDSPNPRKYLSVLKIHLKKSEARLQIVVN